MNNSEKVLYNLMSEQTEPEVVKWLSIEDTGVSVA